MSPAAYPAPAYRWPLLLNGALAAALLWPVFTHPELLPFGPFSCLSVWGNFVGIVVSLAQRRPRGAAWFGGLLLVMLLGAWLAADALPLPAFVE